MRNRVRIDARLGDQLGSGARSSGPNRRGTEEGRGGDPTRELRTELAEGSELRPLADQPERRNIPERGGAPDPEHDLVPLGQAEEVGEALPEPPDLRSDRLLPVRSAQ